MYLRSVEEEWGVLGARDTLSGDGHDWRRPDSLPLKDLACP